MSICLTRAGAAHAFQPPFLCAGYAAGAAYAAGRLRRRLLNSIVFWREEEKKRERGRERGRRKR